MSEITEILSPAEAFQTERLMLWEAWLLYNCGQYSATQKLFEAQQSANMAGLDEGIIESITMGHAYDKQVMDNAKDQWKNALDLFKDEYIGYRGLSLKVHFPVGAPVPAIFHSFHFSEKEGLYLIGIHGGDEVPVANINQELRLEPLSS